MLTSLAKMLHKSYASYKNLFMRIYFAELLSPWNVIATTSNNKAETSLLNLRLCLNTKCSYHHLKEEQYKNTMVVQQNSVISSLNKKHRRSQNHDIYHGSEQKYHPVIPHLIATTVKDKIKTGDRCSSFFNNIPGE